MRIEVLPGRTWAKAVAAELADRLAASTVRLCLATGATPVPVYEELSADALASSTVFLLDEFGDLPIGHPARCETMLRTALLNRVPPREFHFPHVDAPDLAAECARYHLMINDGGLDLALLGLGTNGHLGLNEPGSMLDQATRVVKLTEATREGTRRYGADPLPTWGLAVGLVEIMAATEAWLLVTGPAKAEVLRKAMHDPPTEALPASFLQTHSNATIWADQEAAALL